MHRYLAVILKWLFTKRSLKNDSLFQRNEYCTTIVAILSLGELHVKYSRVMTMRSNNHMHVIGSRVLSRARYINLPWKIRTVHSLGGS